MHEQYQGKENVVEMYSVLNISDRYSDTCRSEMFMFIRPVGA
jgi:hypothetical protein